DFDVTIPRIGGWYEPLHAIYAKSCIVAMEKSIQKGNRQIISFFDDVMVRPVTEDEIRLYTDPDVVFRNINYRSDAEDK
ncbi:MAG: molybdenum cofactor guanylyltransferase, partial [Spirochaetes bacterium]|nr:molybdenum cofactor guanylyltransferase [Spirochaetota bacterium]